MRSWLLRGRSLAFPLACALRPGRGTDQPAFDIASLPTGPQVRLSALHDLAVNVQRVPDGAALHIIRYNYDASADRVPPLDEVCIDLRLSGSFQSPEAFAPDGASAVELESSAGTHHLTLRNLPLYGIVLLHDKP